MDLVVKLLGVGELQLVFHVGVVANTWKRGSVTYLSTPPASSILQEPNKCPPPFYDHFDARRVLNPQNRPSLGSSPPEIYTPFMLVECSVTLIS